MAATGARSHEELARELNVPLRSLQRLSSGKGPQFERTVYLLERAGLINIPEGELQNAAPARPPGDPQAEIAKSLDALLAGQEALLAALGVRLDEPESPPGSPIRRLGRQAAK